MHVDFKRRLTETAYNVRQTDIVLATTSSNNIIDAVNAIIFSVAALTKHLEQVFNGDFTAFCPYVMTGVRRCRRRSYKVRQSYISRTV